MNRNNRAFFKYLTSNRYTFVTSIIFLLVSLLFSSFGFLATIQGREEIKENTKHFKEDAFIIDGLFPNLSSDSFKEISNIIESNFLEVKEANPIYIDGFRYSKFADFASLLTISDFSQISWFGDYKFVNDTFSGYIISDNYAKYLYPDLTLDQIIGKTFMIREMDNDYEMTISNICIKQEYKGLLKQSVKEVYDIGIKEFKVFSLISEKYEIHKKIYGKWFGYKYCYEISLKDKYTPTLGLLICESISDYRYIDGLDLVISKIGIYDDSVKFNDFLATIFFIIAIVTVFFSIFINGFLYYLFLVKKQNDSKLRLLLGAEKKDLVILSFKYLLFLNLSTLIVSLVLETISISIIYLVSNFATLNIFLVPILVTIIVSVLHLLIECIITPLYYLKRISF